MAPLAHPAPCPGQEVPGQPFHGPERSGGLPSQRLAVWGGAENMPGPGLKAGVSSSHTEIDRPRIYPTYTMGCPTVPRRRGQVGPRWRRVALSPGDPAADTQRSSLRKCSQQSQVCSWVPPTWCPQPPRSPDSTSPSYTCHSRWVPWKMWSLPPATLSRQAAKMGELMCLVNADPRPAQPSDSDSGRWSQETAL